MNERTYGEDIIRTAAGMFRVTVVHAPDENPSPREDHTASLARLVLSHPRHALPREGDIADRIDEALQRLDSFEDVTRWLRLFHGASVVLPVWANDSLHKQIRLHTGGGRPGIGLLAGLAYDDPQARAALGIADPAEITAALVDAVDTFNRWINGEQYAYRVERLATDGPQDPLALWSWADAHGGYHSVTDAMTHGTNAARRLPASAQAQPHAEPPPHTNVTALAVQAQCEVGGHAAAIGTTTITDARHTLTLTGDDAEWRGSCSCGDWATADPMKHKSSIRRAHARHVQSADTDVASVQVFVSPLDGAIVVQIDTSLTRDVPIRVSVNDDKVFDEYVEA